MDDSNLGERCAGYGKTIIRCELCFWIWKEGDIDAPPHPLPSPPLLYVLTICLIPLKPNTFTCVHRTLRITVWLNRPRINDPLTQKEVTCCGRLWVFALNRVLSVCLCVFVSVVSDMSVCFTMSSSPFDILKSFTLYFYRCAFMCVATHTSAQPLAFAFFPFSAMSHGAFVRHLKRQDCCLTKEKWSFEQSCSRQVLLTLFPFSEHLPLNDC